MQTTDVPFRLPAKGERAVPFIDWLEQRLGGDRAARQRMTAFIQEWDHLRDEVRDRDLREPTIGEYAERWNVPESTAYRWLDEFRQAVGIDYPGPLCSLLWDGMPRFTGREPAPQLQWLLAVEIVPLH